MIAIGAHFGQGSDGNISAKTILINLHTSIRTLTDELLEKGLINTKGLEDTMTPSEPHILDPEF